MQSPSSLAKLPAEVPRQSEGGGGGGDLDEHQLYAGEGGGGGGVGVEEIGGGRVGAEAVVVKEVFLVELVVPRPPPIIR